MTIATIYALGWLAAHLSGLLVASLAVRASRRVPMGRLAPPISVVKPVYGLPHQAEACWRSWLEQDYAGPLEIIFSLQDLDDPALPVLRRLVQGRRARILVNPVRPGFGGKTSNLSHGIDAARHELLVLSDADMLAPPDTLRRIVGAGEQGADLVGCLPCHGDARGLWGGMYAQSWNGVILIVWGGSMVLGRPAGLPGGTVAITRRHLARIGGITAVAAHLAEDIAMGKAARAEGLRLGMGPPVNSPVGPMSWQGLWDKLRRGMLVVLWGNPHGAVRSVLLLCILAAYLPWGLAALGLEQFGVAALMGGLSLVRMLGQGTLGWLAGDRWRPAWSAPLGDLLGLVALAVSLVDRRVRWGGMTFRVCPDGRMKRIDAGAADT